MGLGKLMEFGEAGPLEGWIVIGVEVVEPDHRGAALQETAAEMETDKTGSPGVKNGHRRRKGGIQPRGDDRMAPAGEGDEAALTVA